MKKLLTITGICVAMALPALAGPDGGGKRGERGKGGPDGKGGKRPSPEQVFEKLDADKSGGISLEEFKAGPMAKRAKDPSKIDEHFGRMDADSDGIVSQKELVAAFKRRAGGKGGPGGKPGEGKRGEGKKGDRPARPDSKKS